MEAITIIEMTVGIMIKGIIVTEMVVAKIMTATMTGEGDFNADQFSLEVG